ALHGRRECAAHSGLSDSPRLCEAGPHRGKRGYIGKRLIRKMTNSNHQEGFVVWMTGLSGAGKTTIALILVEELKKRGVRVERLDGDVVRESLTRDLGFSKEDRDMNIERVTFVAKLLSRNGVGCICSFISPYQEARDKVRASTTNFLEVFIDAPLEV